jgi:hypothetical protein
MTGEIRTMPDDVLTNAGERAIDPVSNLPEGDTARPGMTGRSGCKLSA